MERRTFVRWFAGVGGLPAVAGCLNVGTGGTVPTNTPAHSTETPMCPTFSSEVDVTVCADAAGSTSPVVLEPESKTFTVVPSDRKVETFALTLRNRSERPFATSPGAWTVVRRSGDDWTETATGDETDESIRVEAGGVHVWSLSLTPHPTPRTEQTTFVTADLVEGQYLFAVVGQFEADSGTQRVECHAQFELEEETTMKTSDMA